MTRWCSLHEVYFDAENGECGYCAYEAACALAEHTEVAHAFGAFRALADIGLSIAGGELLLAADSIAMSLGAPSRHGPATSYRLRHLNVAKDAILGRDRTPR